MPSLRPTIVCERPQELGDGRARVGAAARLVGARERAHRRGHHVRLGRVAAVDGRPGHTGLGGDRLDRRAVVALAAEQPQRRRDDLPVGVRVARPAGSAWCRVGDCHRRPNYDTPQHRIVKHTQSGEFTLMPQTQDRKGIALFLLCAVQFMVVLDIAIVNVALPTIKTALDFKETDLQWVINAYTLTFGGLLLLGGRAADLLGRRRMFLIGLAALLGRVARLRPRDIRGHADRRPRGAGRRRGDHLAGRAVDPHDHVRGGRRAQQGARHLGRDRRHRRRRGRAARRHPHRSAELVVDLLHQRPGGRRS